jgi:cell division protein FtsB
VVLAVVIVLLLLAMIKPLYNAVHTYRQAGQSKVRLHQAQAEHATLERQVKRARSDAMLQREARRQGMIMPGEEAWVVNGIK